MHTIVTIVGPPLIKGGGGVGPSKNWVTWGGVPKTLLERGVDVEMEGEFALSYYFTVQLHLLCVGKKSKVCFITF